MKTHTEIPWSLHHHDNGKPLLIENDDGSPPWTAWKFSIAEGDKIVCEVRAWNCLNPGYPRPTTREEALAYAELIIRSVNYHDELVAALENLENDNGSIPEHAWNMVQSAILKAKGEAP